MSFIEQRNEIRPASGEAPFGPDEVFFSRTDPRGVIRSGNYVFRRVAAFDWPELEGAPHKIIRHPDMPRGVFWLLWHTIKAGRPIGAYVKNRAKDGLHYWVFAVIAPTEDGYLSARIKPTSALFRTIEAEYATLRRRELDEDLDPETSAGILLERLRALGFAEYTDFETRALSDEMIARAELSGRRDEGQARALRSVLDSATQLRSETEALVADFDAMQTVPHNLRVIASRLEPTGGPISTLSQNYGAMSRDMSTWFEDNILGSNSNFTRIQASATKAMFLNGLSDVLRECDRQLTAERRKLGDMDIEAERGVLRSIVAAYGLEADAARALVDSEARRILTACGKMDRHVLGLSTTRVMCKIESARIPQAGASLADIIAQLKVFQDRIDARLAQIVRLGDEIAAAMQ